MIKVDIPGLGRDLSSLNINKIAQVCCDSGCENLQSTGPRAARQSPRFLPLRAALTQRGRAVGRSVGLLLRRGSHYPRSSSQGPSPAPRGLTVRIEVGEVFPPMESAQSRLYLQKTVFSFVPGRIQGETLAGLEPRPPPMENLGFFFFSPNTPTRLVLDLCCRRKKYSTLKPPPERVAPSTKSWFCPWAHPRSRSS